MNRIAIAFSTKDRTELSKRSVEPLLQPDKFDLFWVDGSRTDEGRSLPHEYGTRYASVCVYGGSGAAIVFALSAMLKSSNYVDPKLNHGWSSTPAYNYVGLCENDVLLAPDWFDRTMALFDQGAKDGLKVGAVSARCYEDRILVQRAGYAICHNLGAGHIIFTREAAQLVLDTYRTQWTTHNRKIFSLLSGIDIGSYWAFRGSEHFLVADWRWDAVLASHGFASLALTPSPVEMIGQPMPLADMGLTLATGDVERLDDNPTFKRYRDNLKRINGHQLQLPDQTYHHDPQGGTTYFAHQIPALGGVYTGDWRLRDSIGYGPFAWQADLNADHPTASLTVPIFGPCEVLVSGGPHGGQAQVDDLMPTLPAESETGQLLSVVLQSNSYRPIVIKALSPGVSFYGIRTREPQPVNPQIKFNYSTLPRV